MASRDLEANTRQPLLGENGRPDDDDSKLADEASNPDRRGLLATALTMVLSIPALGATQSFVADWTEERRCLCT